MQQGVSLAPQMEERRGAQKGIADFVAVFLAGFKTHLLPHLLALAILVSGHAVVELGGGTNISPSFQVFIVRYLVAAASYVLVALLLIKFLRMVFVDQPEKPLFHLWQWAHGNLTDGRRIANGIHGLLFTFMVMGGFTMWKNQVAVLGHFAWDKELVAFELFFHGGMLPQDILALVIGFPLAAKILDLAYLLWFPMLFGSTFIMSFQPQQTVLRFRFMMAFALTWVLGGIITANIFASAGPVYYGRLNPAPDVYAGHMELIRSLSVSAHLEALALQDSLWAAYAATPSFSSISAFPSMHVAIAMLVFLACRHLGWLPKAVSAAYLILIFIGSIFLGWHYAIDGYAGAGFALASWWIAGFMARYWLTNPSA